MSFARRTGSVNRLSVCTIFRFVQTTFDYGTTSPIRLETVCVCSEYEPRKLNRGPALDHGDGRFCSATAVDRVDKTRRASFRAVKTDYFRHQTIRECLSNYKRPGLTFEMIPPGARFRAKREKRRSDNDCLVFERLNRRSNPSALCAKK